MPLLRASAHSSFAGSTTPENVVMWLKNKKAYYTQISREDDSRLNMMEERYRKSIEAVTAGKPA